MDSLLASYASSDEEDDDDHHHQQQPPQPTTLPHPPPPSISSTTSSLFSSLPKPQSSSSSSSSSSPSSFFSSLPPPKSSSTTQSSFQVKHSKHPPKSSVFFSSIPPPKTQTTPDFPLPPLIPKRVVQFRPPLPQSTSKFDDDEDEEYEEEIERKKKRQLGQDTSVKSFLSSMPNPKNSMGSSLGTQPNSSGSSRRSIIETNESTPLSSDVNEVKSEVGFESNIGNGQENWVDGSHSYDYEVGVTVEQRYTGYESYDVYGSSGYDTYGNYDASSGVTTVPEISGHFESFVNMGGKRRKDQPPPEIVEVKQDELIKDRPREDKSKLTGIAFGPSYQPASTKGKPSKVHKRKHQIGALYFDMRQKEMEHAERRSKGLLTKAETQAKYGW